MERRAEFVGRRGRRLATCLAILGVLALSGCGGSSDETNGETSQTATANATPAQLSADAEAQTAARLASTALETYAVDHNGSYAGATVAQLRGIEPTIPANVRVRSSDTTYRITAPSSKGGNEFTIVRTESTIKTTCKKPGTGACSPDGIW